MANGKQRAIKNIVEFKRLASRKRGIAYHIFLNFDLRSSKWAQFIQSSKRYVIDNYIDNTRQIMSEKTFLSTITAKAIKAGACIMEG